MANLRIPSIKDVARCLREIKASYLDEEGQCDVRLQVMPESDRGVSTWSVKWGLSDYDQDHRGYWGASGVDADMDRAAIEQVAAYLIEQVREAAAEEGADV